MAQAGPLSYASVKPQSVGLVVELLADGGVRVARRTPPGVREVIGHTAAGCGLLLFILAVLAIYALVFSWGIPAAGVAVTGFGFACSTTCLVYWVAFLRVNGGVVTEIVVRHGRLEWLRLTVLGRRRRRWPATSIRKVAVRRDISDKRWKWVPILVVKRHGGWVTLQAFKAMPPQELEWAASAIREGVGLEEQR